MSRGLRVVISLIVAVFCSLFPGAAGADEPQCLIREIDGHVTITHPLYLFDLSCADGLGWLGMRNSTISEESSRGLLAPPEPSRIFEVTLIQGEARHEFSSLDFVVERIAADRADACSLDLRAKDEAVPLACRVAIRVDASCQSEWSLAFTYPDDAVIDLVFPIIEGIEMGPDLDDVGYFFPREPGLMNHVPIRLATNYGQYAQTQLVSLFNDRWGEGGGGLYYFIKDTSLRRKSFELEKRVPGGDAPLEGLDEYGFPFWLDFAFERGIGVASTWPHIPLEAGTAAAIAPVAIGIHPGNWRHAFAAYRAWVNTWYEVERTPAFRRVFAFHAFELFGRTSARDTLAAVPLGVDQLHFMVQPRHVNGEYGYRKDWGLKGLRRFIEGLDHRGILSSHYIEGYIASEHSTVFKEHGAQWGQKKKDGSNVVAFANMAMCPAAQGWTGFLADTAARLVRDLDFDVIYLDEVGFGTGDKYVCHNPKHGHPPPYLGMTSVRRMFMEVREAIRKVRPDAVLTTEGPVVDLWYPYLDGNEGYGARAYQQTIYGPPIHFMRFLYPDFKYVDLRDGTPNQRRVQMKQILFNGTAGDIDPANAETFDAQAAHMFDEHRDAFTDSAPSPHIPTRQPGLYCNGFSAGDKTLYTLWNDNSYPVAGALLPLTRREGMHLVEVVHNRELTTQRVDDQDHVVLAVDGQDVAVVAALPKRIAWQLDGTGVLIDWAKTQGELASVRIDAEGRERMKVGVTGGDAADEATRLSLVELTGQGAYRSVLKLFEDGDLVDEAVLPAICDIDLAQFATATAIDTGNEHTRHPESVIQQDTLGNWEFRWDDAPRPGWVQLTWEHPQALNTVRMQFSKNVYSPQDYELQWSDTGAHWQTLCRGAAKTFTTDDRFDPVTVRYFRVVFHKGGAWANLVQLVKLAVFFTPECGRQGAAGR